MAPLAYLFCRDIPDYFILQSKYLHLQQIYNDAFYWKIVSPPGERQYNTPAYWENMQTSVLRSYIIRAKFGQILQIPYGLHAFGYNPPKLNRFGRNLEHCEPNVAGWQWQILGAIYATVWEGADILFFCEVNRGLPHDFTDLPSDKFYDIWTQQRQSVSPCKLSEQNFEKNTIHRLRGRFPKKCKNC